MSHSLKAVLAALALVAAYVLGALVDWPLGGRHNDGTVKVSGSGSTTAVPDQMVLSLTVRTKRATTAAALQAASAAMTTVIDKAGSLGVDKRDLRTEQVTVEPDTTYSRKSGEHVVGYWASQALRVTVRDLAKGGEILSALIEVGGNDIRLDQTQLRVTNKNEALQEARLKAIKSARTKATQYAEATGRSLGPVLRITEYGGTSAAFLTAATDSAAAKGTPIEPGEQKIKVTVTTTWRLK